MGNKKLLKQLSKLVKQTEQLAARPARAVVQAQELLSVCNNTTDLANQIGQGLQIPQEQQQEVAKLLALPQLLAKVLRSAASRGVTASRQQTYSVSGLSAVLKSCCVVCDHALGWEDQQARRFIASGMADHILSCDVLDLSEEAIIAIQVIISNPVLQAKVPKSMGLPMLHLWWWYLADQVCAAAGDSRDASARCTAASAGLIMAVARWFTPTICIEGAEAVESVLRLLHVAHRLLEYPDPWTVEVGGSSRLQRLFTTPAFLQVVIMLLVLYSRRVAVLAAASQQQGGATSCYSRSSNVGSSSSSPSIAGSSCSDSSATASAPAAAAVEAAPVAAQSLLPVLQLHQQQLWQALGLPADTLNVFDASLAKVRGVDSMARAMAGFKDAAVQTYHILMAITCPHAPRQRNVADAGQVAAEQLQQIPQQLQQLKQKQQELLQSVMWDLPVVLLGTAALLPGDPNLTQAAIKPADILMMCWQLSTESASAAPAAASETVGLSASAAAPAADGTALAAEPAAAAAQQQCSPQQQQALAHVLQCWLALMQQILQEQNQQLAGIPQQATVLGVESSSTSNKEDPCLVENSCSNSSAGSSSSSSPGSSSSSDVEPQDSWDVLDVLLRALRHAACNGPQASSVWQAYAAQISMTLELFLRSMLAPLIASGGSDQQQHNGAAAAGSCSQDTSEVQQQQQLGQQPEQLNQLAQQQLQLAATKGTGNGTPYPATDVIYQRYVASVGALRAMLYSASSMDGPLPAASKPDAASSSRSRTQRLLSLLATFAKMQQCSPAVCRFLDCGPIMECVSAAADSIAQDLLGQPGICSMAELQAAVAPWLVLQARYLSFICKHVQTWVSRAPGQGGSSADCFDDNVMFHVINIACVTTSVTVRRVWRALWVFEDGATLHAVQQFQQLFQQPPLAQQQDQQPQQQQEPQQQQQQAFTSAISAAQQNCVAAGAGDNSVHDVMLPKSSTRGLRVPLGRLSCLVENVDALLRAAAQTAQRLDSSSSACQQGPCGISQDAERGNCGTTATSSSISRNCGVGSSSSSSSGAKLSEADAAALQAACSPSECVSVLLQSSCMQALPQLLQDVDAALCAALPVPCMCNNPGCSNMACSSELLLVGGKGSVCGGCKAARYCGRACQAAHWKQHKPACRYLAAQQHSGAEGEGDRAASSAAQT